MAGPANPDVAWAIEDIKKQLPRRKRALDYYEGRHPLNFATEKFRNTFGELFQELADNLCDDVVDEPTDRLQIEGWSGTGPGAEAASQWWEDNRGAARSGSVHRDGNRSGDGFAIVWEDGDGIPRLYPQDPRTMAIRYSTLYPDRPEVAAKCWREGKGYRLNLYYPPTREEGQARIEHYFSRGTSNSREDSGGIPMPTSFLPFQVGNDGEDNHVPPVEFHDHGFPVFHFPADELSGYGRSVLADIYPLQDALNKELCDFLVTSEAYAQPKRFFAGIQVVRDPVTGQEISPFKDGQNTWWTAADAQKVSGIQFPAAEMKGFMDALRMLRLEIGRKGFLPAHSVDPGSGDAPSGLSLLVSEGKLVKRVKDRQRDWGVVWRELVAYALRWMGHAVTAADLDISWGPIETRDEQALMEALTLKKALGVPVYQLLLEAGYTMPQVQEFAGMAEGERAAQLEEVQAMLGGRISVPGSMLPGTPAPPGGAAVPTPAGAA